MIRILSFLWIRVHRRRSDRTDSCALPWLQERGRVALAKGCLGTSVVKEEAAYWLERCADGNCLHDDLDYGHREEACTKLNKLKETA